ncbi:hypothetical protein O3G_MSEX006407 [Manduca sexta]|uniref:WAP domain-containing protein n=1 Tax=Manduca sexta TaxID=7130 RepID=A0A922CKB9_MANSE|nr:hypothetical protein O3G_MSEX006407 [Manduca sexta]KAG6450126.1 hypothetical protein O3G_MSEX006407 [Manduca sexta]KAG6450127.1 hypothetical protein O3G_MSEX006407 [Manduca sexta]
MSRYFVIVFASFLLLAVLSIDAQTGKAGSCPVAPPGTITTCDVKCTDDSQCSGAMKCCTYGCRIACLNPV